MGYCAASDVEDAVGGPARLAQLLGNGTATADPGQIAKAIAAGVSEINTALEIKHAPGSVVPPYERVLIDCNALLAAEWAHIHGGSGQEMPPRLVDQLVIKRQWLDLLAQGLRTLGAAPQRTLNQPAGDVDHDPISSAMLPPSGTVGGISVANFRRSGFR